MTDRKVSIGCQFLLSEVEELDQLSERLGVSRNRLLRIMFLEGMEQLKIYNDQHPELLKKWQERGQ